MQWKVHAEICFTVARRNLKATTSCLQKLNAATEKINTLTKALEDLDVLGSDAILTARARVFDEWFALREPLWDGILGLWEV